MKKPLFIDYSDDGFWIASEAPTMPFPRRGVCRNLARLVQELGKDRELVLSEAAEMLLDHDIRDMHWLLQYRRQNAKGVAET